MRTILPPWALAIALLLCGMTLSGCEAQLLEHGVEAGVDANELDAMSPNLASGEEAPEVRGHFLVGKTSMKPMFLLGDTAWALFSRGSREDIAQYLSDRAAKGFNTVMVSLGTKANHYGDKPFHPRADDKPDVARPDVTSGSDPSQLAEYDYWDHLAYAIQEALDRDLHVVFALGGHEISEYGGGSVNAFVDSASDAYVYGRNLGSGLRPFASRVSFAVMDDRAAVYGATDYRPLYRALAEGIADGVNGINAFDGAADYSTTLMTALPRKQDPSSSYWFGSALWLDFNSIQAWPADGRARVQGDFAASSGKPTWVLEGRYENYNTTWLDWSQRYQAYIPVFAGALGAFYGESLVCIFDEGWKPKLDAPGAQQVGHLVKLMSEWRADAYLSRAPDQSLLVNFGTLNNTTVGGDFQQATRAQDGSIAMVYAMNRRSISVQMSKLAGPLMRAFWFSPKTGKWMKDGTAYPSRTDAAVFATVPSGSGAEPFTFDPPGTPAPGNDWVLLLERPVANPSAPADSTAE